MPYKSPITEKLLLTLSFISLLGVASTITFISLTNENITFEDHFQRFACRFAFAMMIFIIVILELTGCNWDRGYLNIVIDFVNVRTGRWGTIVLEEEERSGLVDEEEGKVEKSGGSEEV